MTALHFSPDLPQAKDLPAAFVPEARQARLDPGADSPRLTQEVLDAGLPGLAFWAGFALKDARGRVIGVLGVMDEVPRDLPEVRVGQLRQLAQLISGQIGLVQTAAIGQAQRTFAILEAVAAVHPAIGTAAVTGLLCCAMGEAPTADEAMDLRRAGLAIEDAGRLHLTPMARALLIGPHGGATPEGRQAKLRLVPGPDGRG